MIEESSIKHAQLYDPTTGCPHCHATGSLDRWMPALDEYYAKLPERVSRTCNKCGFEWWEKVRKWWKCELHT